LLFQINIREILGCILSNSRSEMRLSKLEMTLLIGAIRSQDFIRNMRDIISLVGEVVPCLKEKTFFLAAVSVNFINIE